MPGGLNPQLETYPANFQNQPIPDTHLPDQLGINTDTGIPQNPNERGA